MFLFIRLLLAHLIGDFPLQLNRIYKAKISGPAGKIIHVLIIGILLILFSWPYWQNWRLWVFIFFICITHYIQDWAKIYFTQKWKIQYDFYFFSLDQIFHILFITICLFFHFAQIPPEIDSENPFLKWYFSDPFILILIAFLLVGYTGAFLIGMFKARFLSKTFETPFLDPIQKTYGIIERILMFSILIFLTPVYHFLFLLFILSRYFFANRELKKFKGEYLSGYLVDTLLGMVIVLIIYLCFRPLMN